MPALGGALHSASWEGCGSTAERKFLSAGGEPLPCPVRDTWQGSPELAGGPSHRDTPARVHPQPVRRRIAMTLARRAALTAATATMLGTLAAGVRPPPCQGQLPPAL